MQNIPGAPLQVVRVCHDFRNSMDCFAMQTDDQQEVQSYAVDFASGLTRNLRYGKTYLRTLEHQFGPADILANAAERDLLTLDIGASMLRHDAVPLEHQVLMFPRV